MNTSYCESLNKYKRRQSIEVQVGNITLGGNNPIRIQSMTTVDTMDTEGSITQCVRMIKSGCEYIRITAPSIKEAKNLKNIKDGLRQQGYNTPLIADIHFTPNAAEEAAKIVEKVRINPGNFIDKKKFDIIEYTDKEYAQELEKIRIRFIPLLHICKEHNTALRVGTNHGSLSDRIVNRYGDTALGMVESALEFLRICHDENFTAVVISMKSSNPIVMVQAYRLLVARLNEENLPPYPLHLGVTEAGEGEDGRIKSAVGIGTLLEDGLGDTIRVSLTEDPEFEAPVAKTLTERYINRANHPTIPKCDESLITPYQYSKKNSLSIQNIGKKQVPIVLSDVSQKTITTDLLKSLGHHYLQELDKWATSDMAVDYIYVGNQSLNIELPGTIRAIVNADKWDKSTMCYPLFHFREYTDNTELHPQLNFLLVDVDSDTIDTIDETVVLILHSNNSNYLAAIRSYILNLEERGIRNPVIIHNTYDGTSLENFQLHASADIGGLFVDGLGDGVFLKHKNIQASMRISFGILQATRTRITKTEYISCPSCGRTLFDLQETTAKIRERTNHLKGLKIGIMGCIVNGPGEMADADYGYVGSGKGKITLYRGQEVVKKSVTSETAVNELIEIIKSDGKWVEKKAR